MDPSMLDLAQQLLASGANGATIAIFIFIYKLDKRVSHLETLRELEKHESLRKAA